MGVMDIAIIGGTLVTMDAARRLVPNGLVLVSQGVIRYVGPADRCNSWAATTVLRADRKLVLPGLIDAHGHAGHCMVRAMGDRPDLDWLKVAEEVYFRSTTEDSWFLEAQLAALERVKFGVTCGYSMIGSIPRCDDPRYALGHVRGTNSVGLREVIGVGPGLPPWPKTVCCWTDGRRKTLQCSMERTLEVTEQLLHMWRGGQLGSRVGIQVSPSRIGDPAVLGDEALRRQTEEVRRLADEYGVMVHSHAYSGAIDYAYRHLDVLGPRTVLAHCTGITEQEVRLLAQTGTHVAHCPSARAAVRGRCPAPELIDAGVNVALATDGSGPDRTFCLLKEMRVAAIVHRAYLHSDAVLPPGKLLEMVTIDAARALGLSDVVGSLEVGKRADIIIVDVSQPHQVPFAMPVHRLVYTTSGQDVDSAIIDGRVVMEGRRILTVDEESVLSECQGEFEHILTRSGLRWALETRPDMWTQSRYSSVSPVQAPNEAYCPTTSPDAKVGDESRG